MVDTATLVEQFVECVFAEKHVQYSFAGFPLGAVAFSAAGIKLTTDLVNAEAYPGPWATYYISPEAQVALKDELGAFLGPELISFVQPARLQITDKGFGFIKMTGLLNQFNPVLRRRPGVAIEDWTHWELMDKLSEDGWVGLPRPLRKKLTGVPTAGFLETSQEKTLF